MKAAGEAIEPARRALLKSSLKRAEDEDFNP
jgi:hypothetical protein